MIYQQINFFFFLKQEVDGETLWLMNNVDSIKSVFPKYKQQLLFFREREKLFAGSATFDDNKEDEIIEQHTSITSVSALSSDDVADSSSIPKNTQMPMDIEESSISESSMQEINIVRSSTDANDYLLKSSLPDDYRLSILPPSLLNEIDNGDQSKFNNHCKNRQILLDAFFLFNE